MIRWDYNSTLFLLDVYEYRIQCGSDNFSDPVDILAEKFQCRSLEDGTLYAITMYLVNIDYTIKRFRSINANTCKSK